MPPLSAQQVEARLRQRKILPASEKPVIIRPPVLTPVFTPPVTEIVTPPVTEIVTLPVTPPVVVRPPSMAEIVAQAVTIATENAGLVIGPGGIAISPAAYWNLYEDAKVIADRLYQSATALAI